MSLDDERAQRGIDAAHQRRSLLLILASALGLVRSGPDTGEAAKRKTRSHHKNRKGKHKTASGGGCQVKDSEQQILNYIAQAANKYGQSKTVMERVARCESTLDPCAFSARGPYYGLYQYLKSTWNSTPYGNRSIWDPEAQALATGWMWQQGRKNEWSCQ
jgi:hypothetical protein